MTLGPEAQASDPEAHGKLKRKQGFWRRWWLLNGPVVSLLLLSPVIAEVLYGATRVSVLPIVIPEIMTWGCGALLIRYLTRRWRKGWGSMLLMGLALAVAEEIVIQQTSIAPLVGLAQAAYGRAIGVNWVYFMWALGYESVWVVLIPVYFSELLFPDRAHQPWLRKRGAAIAGGVFALGSFMAWYGWTQRARVKIFHMPPYTPPALYIAAGVAMIVLLVAAAWFLPGPAEQASSRISADTVSPAVVGLAAAVLGSGWSAFVLIGFGDLPWLPYGWALAAGLAWAAITLFLIRSWSSRRGWSNVHRFAAVCGGMAGCMLGGFVMFKVGGALTADWIGKAVFNAAFIAWLFVIGRRQMDNKPPRADLSR